MRLDVRTMLLAALIASAVSMGCAGGDTGNSVAVLDNAFSPRTVTINVGGGVAWTWNGNAPHNVVFASGSGIAESQIMTAPASFEAQFHAPGTFPYQCTLHAGMTGTVIVK